MKTSKIKSIIFLLFMGVAFTSCSSDDDNPKIQGPNTFELNELGDDSSSMELQPTFSWNTATDPNGDGVSYDLYLGTNNPPTTKVASNLSKTTFTVEDNLQHKTIYYWKVIAKNDNGGKTESKVSTFTTRKEIDASFMVGKWFFDIQNDEITECEKNSYLEFYDDGTAFATMFKDANGDCIPILATKYNIKFISEKMIKFIILDDKGKEEKDNFFNSEILSITETKMVLKDFAFFPEPVPFKKALD